MRQILINLQILLAVVISLSSCSKFDDLSAPDSGVRGTVTDNISNLPFETEQPNGFRLRLWEINEKYPNPTPNDIWLRPNGTFENSKLFSGQYKLLAMDGAFFPVDTQRVNINGSTEVNFSVTPFLSVKATTSVSQGAVKVNYQLTKGIDPKGTTTKIWEAKILASSSPAVSNAVFDIINGNNKVVTRALSQVPDATITATEYSDEITGLKSGNTYYVRVAARITGGSTKYNYSPVFKVTIP